MPLQQPATTSRHVFFTNARPEAFALLTRAILGRLGYRILTLDELRRTQSHEGIEHAPVEMLILDEHRREVSEEVDPRGSLPILLLTGRAGIREPDPRVIAAVKRPAGLHELYRIFQRHFEERPRSTPRIETDLEVTCHRKGKTWTAALLSLSDNGCLLRGSEAVPLGSTLDMTFRLPKVGEVELEAETAYQLVPDLGLVFSATPPQTRNAIGAYVLETIAAG